MINRLHQKLTRELVNYFYHGKNHDAALKVFDDYVGKIGHESAQILTEVLLERQANLGSESFYDETQLRSAILDSYRKATCTKPYEIGAEKSFSFGDGGGRNPVLAGVMGRIALEGFVESRDPESGDAE